MGSLTNYVDLSITANSAGVKRKGFGVPLIVTHKALFADLYRKYSRLADMVTDGFATDSPEYLAVQAIMSQQPSVKEVAIGRCPTAPTQSYDLTITAADNAVYQVLVRGEGVTATVVEHTAGVGDTAIDIAAALVADLNTVVGKNFTATDNADGTITVTGDAAGDWFSLAVNKASLIGVEQAHADPGLSAELTAINQENSNWYGVYTLFNSSAYVLATAAWVESNKKIYIAEVNETDAILAAAGGGDTLDSIKTSAYARVSGWYYPEPAQMFGAGLLGRCLSIEPGGESWALKQLKGVDPVNLTDTQRSNLIDKNANSYEEVAGKNVSFYGTTGDGDFIDIQRGIDWLDDDMSKSVFEALIAVDKIPYTDAGISAIEGAIRGSLKRAVTRSILKNDPEPSVNVPLVADVPTADRQARLLPNIDFDGEFAGAVHKVKLRGTLSV